MSNSLKQKMAGKLSGSLKTATEDRFAKAAAVMDAGGLLKPPGRPVEPSPAPVEPSAATTPTAPSQTAPKARKAAKQKAVEESTVQAAEEPASQPESPTQSPAPAVRIKVQRETFTMLPAESDKIDEVRTRAAANKFFTTRSAVIRAGILALDHLTDEQLLQVLRRLPIVKPGRGA